MPDFVHLHNHTMYSLLDGACRIKDLISAAKKMGMPSLAITDHGNLFGLIHFYRAAKDAGIKPILGFEAYMAPQSRFDKAGEKGGKETAFHLILLAKDEEGYRNLLALSSIGFLDGFYYKPRIDKEVLKNHSKGIVVLSSCIKGEIPFKIIRNDYEGAKKTALFYRDLFGEDFYLEIQDHGIPEERTAMEGLFSLSRELSIPVIATNDTHYLKREHAEAQDILLCLQTSKDREDRDRLRFATDQLYLKSPDEMHTLFKDTPDVLTRTLEIVEKCNVSLDSRTFHLPRFAIPEPGFESLDAYLEMKSRSGLKERFSTITPELEVRLKHELDVIAKMGYAGYFLIVADFIEFARKQGIPVGPGRGSAAGSLVSYALGITSVNPLRYGLMFDRFLNIDRRSLPDIDVDFCYERRDEIIGYVKKKYGEKNVTQIISFGSMNARGVIRDVGRVLKIPYGDVDQIAKLIPFQFDLASAYAKVPEFKELIDKNETYKKLYEFASVLEGSSRHASTHAAGVVIAPGELIQYVPLYKLPQGEVTTQYDKDALEKVGLLKMDFLGLRTLTVIHATLGMLRRKGIAIDIEHIPYDDPSTFDVFSKGETVGVFQFESAGMREYLQRLQPGCIEDLIAMNALYRPGPMEMIEQFLERKDHPDQFEYLHPRLKPILEETHGVIVYQEQVIRIAHEIGGLSLSKADVLRSAMGKKRPELMRGLREEFIRGAVESGMHEAKATEIFDLMDRFAGYGFNKSHAACYSIVAFQTAYLKAHHPMEFMAANLTSEMGSTDRIVVLINECRRMAITVLPPDVNESVFSFFVTDAGIRFGLGAVKNVGAGAVESIVTAREKLHRFQTLFELCRNVNLRLANRKVLESLILSGATDSLQGTRSQKLAVLDSALDLAQSYQQNSDTGQFTLFEGDSSSHTLDPPLPEVEPWQQGETLRKERELLGFYLSGHPLKRFEEEIRVFSNPTIDRLPQVPTGQIVRLCGIVTDMRTHLDRKEKIMAFITLEDFTGSTRLILFSDGYEKWNSLIQKDEMLLVVGRLDRRANRDEGTVIVQGLCPLEKARELHAKRLCLNIRSDQLSDVGTTQIQSLLRLHSGSCPVFITFSHPDNGTMLLQSKKFKVNPTADLVDRLRSILEKNDVWFEG